MACYSLQPRPIGPYMSKSLTLPLENMTFVLTGALWRPREELIEHLTNLGAKVTSSVTKKTTALVSSDFTKKSSKTKKAETLGIPLWSEKDLTDFIQKNS